MSLALIHVSFSRNELSTRPRNRWSFSMTAHDLPLGPSTTQKCSLECSLPDVEIAQNKPRSPIREGGPQSTLFTLAGPPPTPTENRRQAGSALQTDILAQNGFR